MLSEVLPPQKPERVVGGIGLNCKRVDAQKVRVLEEFRAFVVVSSGHSRIGLVLVLKETVLCKSAAERLHPQILSSRRLIRPSCERFSVYTQLN